MKRIKLMSDVDGVLLNMALAFRIWIKESYDIDIPKQHSWSFNLPKEQSQPLVDEFFDAGGARNMPEIQDAERGLRYLNREFEINLVTSMENDLRPEREENLKGWTYDSLWMDGDHDEFRKMDYVINVLKPQVAIEDKPKIIKKFHEAGIKVFYPKYQYTEGLEEFGSSYTDWHSLVYNIYLYGLNLTT